MKAAFILFIFAVCFSGCLIKSAPPRPNYWLLEAPALTARQIATHPKFEEAVRVSQLSLAAPWDVRSFVVVENDAVQFDRLNQFAADPAVLLKSIAVKVVRETRLFKDVVTPNSAVRAPYALEVSVTRFNLIKEEDALTGVEANVAVTLLKGRELVGFAQSSGHAKVTTAESDCGKAYAQAFTTALVEALRRL